MLSTYAFHILVTYSIYTLPIVKFKKIDHRNINFDYVLISL